MPHREPATVTASAHGASDDTFKSCRVRMKDPTWKVLPRALEQYHINARPEQYALYVVYDGVDRCLALDEKPLALFKKLEKAGKKPVFMLRARVSSPAAGSQHGA
jgi:hypothetical protein